MSCWAQGPSLMLFWYCPRCLAYWWWHNKCLISMMGLLNTILDFNEFGCGNSDSFRISFDQNNWLSLIKIIDQSPLENFRYSSKDWAYFKTPPILFSKRLQCSRKTGHRHKKSNSIFISHYKAYPGPIISSYYWILFFMSLNHVQSIKVLWEQHLGSFIFLLWYKQELIWSETEGRRNERNICLMLQFQRRTPRSNISQIQKPNFFNVSNKCCHHGGWFC